MKKDVLAMILEVSQKISSSLELEKVGELVLKNAKTVLSADNGALFLFDKTSQKPMLVKAIGFNNNQIHNLKVMASWEIITKEIVKKSKTLMINDLCKSKIFNIEKIPFFKEKIHLGAFVATPIKINKKVIGIMIISHNQRRKKKFSVKDKQFAQTLSASVAVALVNAQLYKQTKKMFLNTIAALITAVDARDPYTYGHSKRVSQYAMEIATEYGLSKDEIDNVRFSGLLHDIGKIGIRDNILAKKSKLSIKERKLIEQHPLIGSRIVSSVLDSDDVLQGIEQHHEFFNGKGYPNKLKGDKISVFGKILAVADAFDCLTTKRPYKKAYAPSDAFDEICCCSKKQYDPKVVEAFKTAVFNNPKEWKLI